MAVNMNDKTERLNKTGIDEASMPRSFWIVDRSRPRLRTFLWTADRSGPRLRTYFWIEDRSRRCPRLLRVLDRSYPQPMNERS